MRISLLLILVTVLFTISAEAMLAKSNYKWWKDPQIVSELDLSKEQVKKIDHIFKAYRGKIFRFRKNLKQSEVELKKELQNPDANKEDVLKLIDGIETTKAAYTRMKVEMFLKVKDVLTPEQEETLHRIKLRFRPYNK